MKKVRVYSIYVATVKNVIKRTKINAFTLRRTFHKAGVKKSLPRFQWKTGCL